MNRGNAHTSLESDKKCSEFRQRRIPTIRWSVSVGVAVCIVVRRSSFFRFSDCKAFRFRTIERNKLHRKQEKCISSRILQSLFCLIFFLGSK
jgi:hypothetical protein